MKISWDTWWVLKAAPAQTSSMGQSDTHINGAEAALLHEELKHIFECVLLMQQNTLSTPQDMALRHGLAD